MTTALASAPAQLPVRPSISVRLDAEFAARPMLECLLHGAFSALGERHQIGTSVDWRHNPSADIEWLILLNKFYHAPGLVQAFIDTRDRRYLDLWKSHLRQWIATMEPGFIAADVTGRRLQNWVYAISLWDADGQDKDDYFRELTERSLATQADWLRDNLHPSRNHRTIELFALLLVAVWLDRRDDCHWVLGQLADNAAQDFLPDGVHVERSSHYHCLALRNLLDARQLATDNGIAVPGALADIIERARHFAHVLHKPDGLIPALSDADVGDYRAMLGPCRAITCCEFFPHGGYAFLRDDAAVAGDPNGQYLVLDCGPIGEGNHGHLDCLSIEFAALGRSLIVDPGRYTYFEGGPCNDRAAFRGTAAHNLVQVDGLEQTLYRQGPKRMKIAGPSPDAQLLHADAYMLHARATSQVVDVRQDRIIVRGDGWWIIHDRMSSPTQHDYDLRFQLSAQAQGHTSVSSHASGGLEVRSPDLRLISLSSGAAEAGVEAAWVSPAYGIRHAAPRIRVSQHGSNAWFSTLLLPFSDDVQVSFSADDEVYLVRLGDGPVARGKWPC